MIISKDMMHGISEQYADDIATYHFLNVPSGLIYDKRYSFYRGTTTILFSIVLIIVNLIIFH